MLPPASLPSVTVVICTRDRPEALDRCLAALAEQSAAPAEVLVVDNAPVTDGARVVAARRGVRYLLEPAAGLSRARNAGARDATGEVVAYLDDDAVPDREWLAHMQGEFRDPEVGGVTGRCLALNEGPAARAMEACWSGGTRRRFMPGIADDAVATIRGAVGVGMNMAFRRALLVTAAPFHLRLGRGATIRGGEEQTAFLDVLWAGSAIIYTPAAVVRHPTPSTVDEFEDFQAAMRADYVAWLLYLVCESPRHRTAAQRAIRAHLAGRSGGVGGPGRGGEGLLRAVLAGGWAYFRSLGGPIA